MKKLVLSQTCQGTVLETLLMSSEAFSREFTCTFIPNFEIKDGKPGLAAAGALEAALEDCNVLVYHDVAHYNFPALLARMPADSLAVKIPYITSTIYWPTQDYLNPCWLAPRGSSALIPWPCKVLSSLIATTRSRTKAIDAYLNLDLTRHVDVEANTTRQIEYLRKAEAGTIFSVADFVAERFASVQLFHLINHPSLPVFLEVANRILAHLELPQLEGFPLDPFWNHQMPVHPSIIRHFNLTWCTPDTRFLVLDKEMTFEEYVVFYVDEYIARYQYTMYPVASSSRRLFSSSIKKLKRLFAPKARPRA